MINILTRSASFPTNILIKNYCLKKKIPLSFFNPFDEIFRPCDFKENKIILPRTSGVLFDDIDLHLAEELEKSGQKIINSPSSIRLIRDKDRQFLKLKREQLAPLPFALCRGKIEDLQGYLEAELKDTTSGFLVKSIRSNLGKGQYKKNNFKELNTLWNEFLKKEDQRFLITPFMKEFNEYRVLFIGDHHFGIEKAPGIFGHQRNSDNSNFSKFEIPKEMLELTKKIKLSFELHYGAIDFVKWKKQLYVLEVNSCPGFSHLQNIFEEDISEILISSALNL